MKGNLIILLFSTLFLMFTACESKSKRCVDTLEIDTIHSTNVYPTDLGPDVKINNTFKFKGQTYYDVTYRGCEYIVNHHNGIFVHKGNCKSISHINIK